jgi:acetylornithine aminotransferase
VFEPGDHATTFGGQPLATAAARAVLATMEALDAPGRAAKAGERLAEQVAALPGVAGVRGQGLLLGVELAGLDARAVNAALLSAGVVANAVTPTALRFAPSLLIDDDQIDEAVAVLGRVLAAAAGTGAEPDAGPGVVPVSPDSPRSAP